MTGSGGDTTTTTEPPSTPPAVTADSANNYIDGYNSYGSPIGRAIALTAPVFLVLILLVIGVVRGSAIIDGPAPLNGVTQTISGAVFILYLAAFVAMWIVYFRSRGDDPKVGQVRSLRRLLMQFSVNWNDARHHESKLSLDELRTEHQSKADKSIVVLTILVAAAIIILVQASNISIGRKAAGIPYTYWDTLVLGSCASFAVIAIVCFLLSADALDTMFNRFSIRLLDNAGRAGDQLDEDEREARQRLIQHFYNKTINPRYYGLTFFLLSLVFIILHHSRPYASFALATTLTLGYYHWYPIIEPLKEKAGSVASIVRKSPWCLRLGILAALLPLMLEPALSLAMRNDVVVCFLSNLIMIYTGEWVR